MSGSSMRFRFRALVLVLLIGVVIGLAIDLLRPKGEARHLSPSDPPAELALEKRIPDVWLENVPLDVAAKRISELSGVPIVLDEEGLRSGGMFTSANVSVRLRNATLASVLDEATDAAGDRLRYFSWYWRGQHITITSTGRPSATITRLYDVRDLLAKHIPSSDDPDWLAKYQQALAASRFPNSPGPPQLPEPPSEALAKFFIDTVMPDEWRDTGGTTGSLKVVGGVMIVTHIAQAHHEIRLMLDQLRDLAHQSDGPPMPLENGRKLTQKWHDDRKQWLPVSSEAVETALDKRIPEFKVVKMPFPQALDAFGKAFGIPVAADKLSKDHPFTQRLLDSANITLQFRDADGYEVLDALLKIAATEAERLSADSAVSVAALWWTIEDGVLVVRYPVNESGLSYSDTRIYDVRDFFAQSRGTMGETVEDLEKLILDNVVPDSWRENGGTAKLRVANGFLIVTQNYPNHYAVRKFLNALRHVGKGPTTQPWRLP